MGISNVSSGLRSGVCTSTTRPSAPYEGQVIYETDTDRVLVWNASAWVMPNQTTTNPNGLELISSATFSNELIVYANNVFSSTYDYYLIESTYSATSATEVGLRLQTGTNTADTTSNYYRYGFYNVSGFSQFNASATNYLFFGNTNTTSSAGVNSSSRVAMFNPNRNDRRTVWQLQHWDAQSGLQLFSSNQHATTTQFTGFRIYCTDGSSTLTGRMNVYGMRQ